MTSGTPRRLHFCEHCSGRVKRAFTRLVIPLRPVGESIWPDDVHRPSVANDVGQLGRDGAHLGESLPGRARQPTPCTRDRRSSSRLPVATRPDSWSISCFSLPSRPPCIGQHLPCGSWQGFVTVVRRPAFLNPSLVACWDAGVVFGGTLGPFPGRSSVVICYPAVPLAPTRLPVSLTFF